MAPRKKKAIKVQNNLEVFDDLNIIEEVEAEKKGFKLDMFKQVLPAIDRRDFGFYGRLTEDQQKAYQPYVVMRWMSATTDNGDMHKYHVGNVNDFVNTDFWSLNNHPELQHKLLCMAGVGQPQRHQWIKFMGGKRKKSAINEFLLEQNPMLRDDELDILKSQTSNEEFEAYIKGLGKQDAEVKKLMKEWKAETK